MKTRQSFSAASIIAESTFQMQEKKESRRLRREAKERKNVERSEKDILTEEAR